MNIDELYTNYYVKFGTYPPIMTTTDGDNEEYLEIIKKAIESGKRLTSEDIDKGNNYPFDLYIEPKEFKTFKKGSK